MRSFLLPFVVLVQLAAIYLFTSGFLLTRLSLSQTNTCSTCTLRPTHTRAVVLIIDALRFDFISPYPPQPPSPFHHNVLELPHKLTALHPESSFIFDAYSDPPTATLQRIKALTTGSLPTFVDIGSNFGGSSILEDSIISRLTAAGKRLAFMGDDTWMSVFPDSFHPNMTFPFDSFNVEDLHTVDQGVIANLFPLLSSSPQPFDFLIGHFLGVDHVGHRVGPEHSSMKDKLLEMNAVLERVVEALDEDTLLVVLGDHGMDKSGDHGGDGVLETSSALWIYSKGCKLSDAYNGNVPLSMMPKTIFPGSAIPYRRVQQIDIVPTLSLLLGLPIPFNNLGTIIPELFNRDTLLPEALSINVAQIKEYLDAYRASPSGSELEESWSSLQHSWQQAVTTTQQHEFTRLALETCRSLWAQFNAVRMGMGLTLLGVGTLMMWSLYSTNLTPDVISNVARNGGYGVLSGLAFGLLTYPLEKPTALLTDISVFDYSLFSSALFCCLPVFIISFKSSSTLPSLGTPLQTHFPILILILHSLSFLSNSFTFWEDRMTPYLLVSSILPFLVKGFTAPTARLRSRILGFSLLFAVCVRLMAISTVCREEQQPYCHVTYYSSSSTPTSPSFIRIIALPVAYALPLVIQRVLAISRSDAGIAKLFLFGVLRVSLLSSSLGWLLEWVDSARIMEGVAWSGSSRIVRSIAGWVAFFGIAIFGALLWYLVPMCLDIKEEASTDDTQLAASVLKSQPTGPKKRHIQIIGFANAFGAPYMLFYSIPFALVFGSTQLTGQVVLALSVVALLGYLEVVDSVRDVRTLEAAFKSSTPSAILNNPSLFGSSSSSPSLPSSSPSIRIAEVVPLALLGIQTFYSTGHQAVISSIQWKSAFILTSQVRYPWSVVTVLLNSFGPLMLAGLSAPLLGMWNRAPLQAVAPPAQASAKGTSNSEDGVSEKPVDTQTQMRVDVTLASLGVMLYHSFLLLGTAVSAAILRRHLMVWKVFAPRFMLGVCEVLAVDLGVLLGVGVGVERIARRVGRMFEVKDSAKR